jgi:hypothetical protein
MKLAIMQPYLFPYIGYYQLINAVDKFVIYDDVNFIKQGWINRNKVLISGKEFLFTLPLKDASSFSTIRETNVNYPAYTNWKVKFLRSLEQSYKKSTYFESVYLIVESVLNEDCISISDFALSSIVNVSSYLGLKTKFLCSSVDFPDTKGLDRQGRLFEIIQRCGAKTYINSIGGQALYAKQDFARQGICLNFLKSNPSSYKQFEQAFVPFLSIIDTMMFNSPSEINEMLDQFELI